jgi:tricorn protease
MQTALRPCLVAVLGLFVTAALAADPIRFMRDPHVANGKIVFSYQGDVWIANEDGSAPNRLTSHLADDGSPKFSPDGQWVAFTSDRLGNNDVWVVPVTGGEPRQLTFHTGSDAIEYWTPDGRGIVIRTSRSSHPFLNPLYVVPIDGGVPTPLSMVMASNAMLKQDGSTLAFAPLGVTQTRQGQNGNRTSDVFVQNMQTGAVTQLTDTDVENFRPHKHDGMPMWGADGMIYFMSEREGSFNIWRISPQGGTPQRVTNHDNAGVKYPAISPDGRKIIYVYEFELWTLEVPSGQPRKVAIDVPIDPRDNHVEFLSVQNQADGFAPSHDGQSVAVDERGEIFIVPVDAETGEKVQVTRSAWRDRYQHFSPDGKYLAFVSDEGGTGEEQIWLFDLATRERRRLTNHASPKTSFLWSPDASRIAFETLNTLFEVDVASGSVRELATNPANGYSVDGYSADGGWLVWSRSDGERNTDVYLFDRTNGREYNVSQSPFRDSNGILTPDGKTVVFTSNRDGTNHLYAVSLQRLTENPADPLVRARRQRADSTGSATPPAQIELQGIERRTIQLTTGDEGAGNVFLGRDGRTIYFTSNDDDGPGLFSIGIDGRDRRRVVAGSFPGLTLTADKRSIFFRAGGGGGGRGGGRGGRGGGGGGGGQIQRMQLGGGGGGGGRGTPISNYTLDIVVNERQEREQIYDEVWRVMKYRFYDPDMHGADWAAARLKYRPLLAHVGTYDELYDLTMHMIGELNASHTGVSGPSSLPTPDGPSTRYLGFEVEPASGGFRISHIYRDGPADREWLGLAVGDYVLAIDGTTLRPNDNYWKILNQVINDFVPVRVAKSANGQDARDVRIETVASLGNLKYEEWIAKNREFVDRESGGKLAYVHMRSMNQASLDRLTRELDQNWTKQGVVIDIRYNGGGNIDQQLFDVLSREPYQFLTGRYTPPSWGRRPFHPIAGPKVMLINGRSASNSEMTPEGFRQLGLGRVVGNATTGAVIATGSYGLINGGSMRTPGSLVITWDPTKPDNHGINMENWGVGPDVFVKNSPLDELNGNDPELKTAVEEALRMLASKRWQYITETSSNSGGG